MKIWPMTRQGSSNGRPKSEEAGSVAVDVLPRALPGTSPRGGQRGLGGRPVAVRPIGRAASRAGSCLVRKTRARAQGVAAGQARR
jgi:hypothetical protein